MGDPDYLTQNPFTCAAYPTTCQTATAATSTQNASTLSSLLGYEQTSSGLVVSTRPRSEEGGAIQGQYSRWGVDSYARSDPEGHTARFTASFGSTTVNSSIPNPFTDLGAGNLSVDVSARTFGWDHQSFGIWNVQDALYPVVSTWSSGVPTPGTAVPLTGNATFSGKLASLYVTPAGQGSIAVADLVVRADFSTRSLNLVSSGTSLTRDFASMNAAPHLDLQGTLTYSSGSNSFAGTLGNAGGTMSGPTKGRFYGPAAQELGGVFTLKSATTTETLVGAYGAKR